MGDTKLKRRPCHYCGCPLAFWATLLRLIDTCSHCAHRMSLGMPARTHGHCAERNRRKETDV